MVVLLVALIILGPQRLPQAGKQVGRAIAEFRRVTSGVQAEIKDALDVSELRDAFDLSKLLADDSPTTASRAVATPADAPSAANYVDVVPAAQRASGAGQNDSIPAPDGSSFFPQSDPAPSPFDHVPAPSEMRDVLADR